MWEKLKEMNAEKKAALLFVALMIVAAIVGWYQHTPKLPTTEPIRLAVAPAVQNVPKVSQQIGSVKVYDKQKLATRMPLPEEVKTDDTKQVSAVSVLPASDNKTEITAVIDTVTKDTILYAREIPQPFMEFESKGRIGVAYGIKQNGLNIAKVYADWAFLRVGPAHLVAQGEINTDKEAKVFAAVEGHFGGGR